MAAYSYQHPTFVFDSFLQPDTSNYMSGFPHQATIVTPNNCVSTMLPDSSGNECFQEIPLLPQIHETINSFHKITNRKGNQDPNSSPTMAEMASGDQLVTEQVVSSTEMKRKNVDAKVGSEQGGQTGRKNKRYARKQKRVAEEAQSDYVHVRARRGQATDSHSLAERVRRAKISVRMKLLQSLVPGCDMITGKAQILDEIIKYVLTLQTQVKFLAAKLSSVTTPMFNDFEVDFNTNLLHQESLDFQLSPVFDSIAAQFASFPEKTPNPNSLLLHLGNDNGNLLWDSDNDHSRTQELSNQICMDNHIFRNYKGN